MKRIALAALAFFAAAPIAHAQEHSPESVAAAILTGFVERDVARIAAHSSAFNAEFFAAVAAGEMSGASVFNGVEGRAATAWDGLILPVRYRDGDAIIPFAIEVDDVGQSLSSGADGRYIALILTLDGPEDQSWGIDDLNFVQRSAYATYSETP
ncbi:hypothetical protein [Jannaschia sp. CCS1]|uniref:hypothetical protein n=1 Tax=Jannaschia sp. (strain CCS1) TaxID=290400 RepID=UPI0002EDC964|nr:hypothetical protein [Jannaschia sp. CCS1]